MMVWWSRLGFLQALVMGFWIRKVTARVSGDGEVVLAVQEVVVVEEDGRQGLENGDGRARRGGEKPKEKIKRKEKEEAMRNLLYIFF